MIKAIILSLAVLFLTPQLPADDPAGPLTVSQSIDLIYEGGQMDEYGNYLPAIPYLDNPVRSADDLKADWEREPTAAEVDSEQLDRFGGVIAYGNHGGTGFYRIETVEGKTWIISPEGHPYFYKAMCTVHPYSYYPASAFATLPERGGEFADAFHPANGNYSPLIANQIRKHGPEEWYVNWIAQSVNRLRNWGFNAVGDWSLRTVNDLGMPHTLTLQTQNAPADKIDRKLVDPFDPALRQWITNQLNWFSSESMNPGLFEDPNLIAYVIGNEMEWAGWGKNKRYLLIENILNKDGTLRAKQDLVSWLKDRYEGDFMKLQQVWNLKVTGFEELLNTPVRHQGDHASEACKADMSRYIERFADQFFRVCVEAIREKDPNHMIWGPRFTFWPPDKVVKVAGNYLDVLAWDIYSYTFYTEVFDRYYEISGNTPFMIAEFGFETLDLPWYFPPDHRQNKPDGLRIHAAMETPERQGEAYAHYVETLAGIPYFVGYSYFHLHRGLATGVVDMNDRYREGFTQRMRLANDRVDAIHQGLLDDITPVAYPRDPAIRSLYKMRTKIPGADDRIPQESGEFPNFIAD
ncbi:MAG: hypothetical protein WD708_04735 [Kiritimatiellia bacterium]